MASPTEWRFVLVLFIGMASAMMLPSVRRSVPRWFESLIWIGLIGASWLTIINVQGAGARSLTDSVIWGAGQMANDLIDSLAANVRAWLVAHRFGIAYSVVLVAVLDVFVLAVLRSHRHAKSSLPRVKLGEWFELQLPEPGRASVPSVASRANLRLAPASAPVPRTDKAILFQGIATAISQGDTSSPRA